MLGRIVLAGMLAGAVFVAFGGVASGAARGSCSTSGLRVAGASYKVVELTASGVPCAKARAEAKAVAGDLARGKPVTLSGGIEGFSMNQSMCGGCRTTTQVALTYATGKVTISLGGKGSPGVVPSVPSPILPPGSGTLIQA